VAWEGAAPSAAQAFAILRYLVSIRALGDQRRTPQAVWPGAIVGEQLLNTISEICARYWRRPRGAAVHCHCGAPRLSVHCPLQRLADTSDALSSSMSGPEVSPAVNVVGRERELQQFAEVV